MALDSAAAERAKVAFQRFGFGPKPGGFRRIGDDPKAAVLAELDDAAAARLEAPNLPGYEVAARLGQTNFDKAYEVFRVERRARVMKAAKPEIGFAERLVTFWSNHFSMSVWKDNTVLATYGQLERKVIRPNLTGSFADMLVGVMQHPAMIAYLDNADSIGPRSPIGKSWGVGLNENLAREILELHTVGTGGGYTEADVTEFARIITGWSFVRGWEVDGHWNGGKETNRGQFIFREDWHEPGAITLMGTRYPAGGIAQGEAALKDLARHPKTAEHIAFKLLLHFVSDAPEEDMVDALAEVFLDTGGDLGAVCRALVEMPRAWSLPMKKLRTPYELAVAQFRATGADYPPLSDEWVFAEPLYYLDNLPWEHGAPDGYADESAAWLNPDGLRVRLDTAQFFADWFERALKRAPADLAEDLFGPALSNASRAAIAGAGDARGGYTALFMAAEFQRR